MSQLSTLMSAVAHTCVIATLRIRIHSFQCTLALTLMILRTYVRLFLQHQNNPLSTLFLILSFRLSTRAQLRGSFVLC